MRNLRASNAHVPAENEKDILRAQLKTEIATLTGTRIELSDSLGEKLAAEIQFQLALLQNSQSRATGEGITTQAPTARRIQKDPNKFTASSNEKNPVKRQDKYETFMTQVQRIISID